MLRGKVSISVRIPGRGDTTRFRTSMPVLALFLFLSASSLFLLGILISEHLIFENGRVRLSQSEQGGSFANLYGSWVRTVNDNRKLTSRAALLEREVDKLRERLISLESTRERNLSYEAKLRAKLARLEEVVHSAVSLGLLDNSKKRGKSRAQPALVDGIAVGGAEIEAKHTSSRDDVGGAEIVCSVSRSECDPWEAGEAVADDNITSHRLLSITSHRLLSEIEHYTELLRALPIGSPARGRLTSGFGFRVSPFGEGVKYHQGLDVAAPYGKSVLATGDGVVVSVRYEPTYGNVIDIQHSPAVLTRYAHLSRVSVRTGARVKRGQAIGSVGSTGRSTGPHLHYEVRVWGRAKNPAKFMRISDHLAAFLQDS